ncbi:MAG: hypothetical protein RR394_09465, partial [Oscillospiraceae bacterium]
VFAWAKTATKPSYTYEEVIKVYSVAVPITGWAVPSPAYKDYTHCVIIPVSGMLASYRPKIYLIPSGTNKRQMNAELDAYTALGELEARAGAVCIYGYGVPPVALTLQLEV